jgi:SpoIID/LytB domain protein
VISRRGAHSSRTRFRCACAAVVAGAMTLVLGDVAAAAPAAPAAPADQPVAPAASGTLGVTGHGWGHGRGLGQWGAFGYAVNQGVSYQDILAHFYGNTNPGAKSDGLITVRLTAQDGGDLIVSSGAPFSIGGVPIAANSAGRLSRRADGNYDLNTRTSCAGPDVWYGGVVDPLAVSSVPDPGNDVTKMLEVCQPDGSTRQYRGSLRLTFGDGATRAINIVSMEQYLRGVVPRESPASWADSGGGKGMQAILAQVVAARSYAWAEGGENGQRYTYAKTCDSTACQVYGGAGLNRQRIEDTRSDLAVAATPGEVRRFSNGALARTEFSSSTGGWTAGGTFPAVEDTGDSASPFHDWSTSVTASAVESTYGVGQLRSINIVNRNGLGDGGGRVSRVQINGSNTSVIVSGGDFQARMGLRSDWFFIIAPQLVTYFERNSNTRGVADSIVAFGLKGDIPLACDWNGDGVDTPGVFRGGQWVLSNAPNGGTIDATFGFGDPTDVPLCGDWDGNGTDTPGVFRKGTFYVRNANSTGVANIAFGYGNPTDLPLVGDWDGNGTDTPGIFRSGAFYLRNANSTGIANLSFSYGNPTDFPVAGDWDGNGTDTPGIFRGGAFYLRNANSTGFADLSFGYGDPNDKPLIGDWDGNGTDTIAVTRAP